VSLTKALKIYDGEKASSTKTAGKLVSGLQKTETRSMFIHPIPVLTQNGSRTLISDPKL
jgi:hypothetical protein